MSRMIEVTCPQCKQSRQMRLTNYRRGGETGLCLSCYNQMVNDGTLTGANHLVGQANHFWRGTKADKNVKALCYNARRQGKLVRQPCETCGVKEVEGHHDDYNKPFEIKWLCRKHHFAWHRENYAIVSGCSIRMDYWKRLKCRHPPRGRDEGCVS